MDEHITYKSDKLWSVFMITETTLPKQLEAE